jgi:hypothetical protein
MRKPTEFVVHDVSIHERQELLEEVMAILPSELIEC